MLTLVAGMVAPMLASHARPGLRSRYFSPSRLFGRSMIVALLWTGA